MRNRIQFFATFFLAWVTLYPNNGIAKYVTKVIDQPQEKYRIKDIDLMIVLDGSYSVGADNFEVVKVFVISIARGMHIELGNVQIGVVQFSHYYSNRPLNRQTFIKTEIQLGEYKNMAEFIAAVDRIKYQGYTTYTAHAINKTLNVDFVSSNNRYPEAKRVLILVTDGRATDSNDLPPVIERAESELGVVMYAVGVGQFKEAELNLITHNHTNRVFKMAKFEDLKRIVKSLLLQLQEISYRDADGSSNDECDPCTPQCVCKPNDADRRCEEFVETHCGFGNAEGNIEDVTLKLRTIADSGTVQAYQELESIVGSISTEREFKYGCDNDTLVYGVSFIDNYTGSIKSPLKILSSVSAINYIAHSDNNSKEIALVFGNLFIQGGWTKDSNKDDRGYTTAKFLLSYLPSIVISVYDREIGNITRVNVSYSVRIDDDAPDIEETISEIRQSSTFFHSHYVNDVKYACEYYESSTQSFSNKGCLTSLINETSIMCDCNHTTIFAVLLAVKYYEISKEVKYVSIVTECFSLLALVVTLVILISVKKTLMSDRTLIQINLTLALLLLHLSSLFTDVAVNNPRTCEMVTVFVHFFLLCSVAWMFLEGFHLFTKTTDWALLFGKQNPKTVARVSLATGWGISFAIVAVSTAVGFSTDASYLPADNAQDGKYLRCWLNDGNDMLLGSAIVPFIVIYSANAIVVIKVTHFVYKMNSRAERFKPMHKRKSVEAATIGNLVHVKTTLKSVIVLFPVLGIPWLFSFFAGLDNLKARTAFQFLNVIFNGLQGFFLFLVYCIVGGEVRKILFRKITTKFNSLTWTSESRSKGCSTVSSIEMSQKLY